MMTKVIDSILKLSGVTMVTLTTASYLFEDYIPSLQVEPSFRFFSLIIGLILLIGGVILSGNKQLKKEYGVGNDNDRSDTTANKKFARGVDK